MRRDLWLKLVAASGLIGGAGTGVYQYVGASPEPQASATLDEAQKAWNAAADVGSKPAPAPATDATPPAPGDRYQPSPFPLPLAEPEPPILRGQNPSDEDEYELQAPLPPVNSLRANEGTTLAADAFGQHMASNPPPAALEAFANQEQAAQSVPAVEPIGDEPGPLDVLPVDAVPLAELPQAEARQPKTNEPPAPFTADAGVGLPPMPAADAPNPLRQATAEEPAASAPPAGLPPFASTPAEPPAAFSPPTAPQEVAMVPPSGLPMQPEPSYDSQPLQPIAEGAGRPGDRSLEGRQQPMLAIQKFAPAEVQVGKACKFLVKIRNDGQRPALDVVVRDQVPAGARLMATSPQADTSGANLSWTIGTLEPGEERTLEMELTPKEEGAIGSVATVSFAAAASVQTNCTKPQLAVRMTAPSKVLVGQEQQIQIEIKNPGTGVATGVLIFENVPENLRHAAGPTLEFAVGDLQPGEVRRLQLNMMAESPGKVVNVLTAQADGNLHVDQKVEFEVVAPSLQVEVDGPKRRYLERPATYTVKVGNPGTAAAHNLRLVTQLPRGMKFVKANNQGEYDAASHAVYWSLAELPAGESGAVQLTAVPVAPGELKLQVKGEAQNGLRDETVHDTRVEGIAAIKFTVLDLEDPIEVGGETEYEVRLANQGTKSATNVTVQVAVPTGMRVISARGDSRHRIQGGVVRFEPLPQLAPRAEMTFRIRVQGAQPGDHRLVVEVGSDDLGQPVRKEESTRVFGDE